MDYYGYRAILDSVVKAKEGSFLSIEKAISKALSDTGGFVTTGPRSLLYRKMMAETRW